MTEARELIEVSIAVSGEVERLLQHMAFPTK